MNKIRKGDSVVIQTGKDKGKQGIISQIIDSKVMSGGLIDELFTWRLQNSTHASASSGLNYKELETLRQDMRLIFSDEDCNER